MREKMLRFDKYMKYKGLNDNRVTLDCGLSQGLLGQARTGKSDLGNATVNKILKIYQDLNRVWLLTGEGNMLMDDHIVPQADDSADNPTSDLYYTYLIPMSAMAGSLVGFDADGVRFNDCERIVSPIAGVDFAISIHGDSMMPEFPSGSRVLIKRIDPTIYIDWGNVFVLDTTNGIILKEVQPSPKEGLLTCHSLNPNGRYKDFDVPMCEIRAMYKVLACVSLR